MKSPAVEKGEAFVVEAEQMQNRRVQVVHRDDFLDGAVTELVGRAVGHAAAHAAACHPDGEALRIVVATIATLRERRAPKLAGPQQQRVIEEPARLEVADERGDLLVGSFPNHQVRHNRPFAGAGRYRTPVEGLYLCGGSPHPGGNITGLCGCNAASVIASDCARPLWWNPPVL
jgi:phytoene dehydrogenase-like protein